MSLAPQRRTKRAIIAKAGSHGVWRLAQSPNRRKRPRYAHPSSASPSQCLAGRWRGSSRLVGPEAETACITKGGHGAEVHALLPRAFALFVLLGHVAHHQGHGHGDVSPPFSIRLSGWTFRQPERSVRRTSARRFIKPLTLS